MFDINDHDGDSGTSEFVTGATCTIRKRREAPRQFAVATQVLSQALAALPKALPLNFNGILELLTEEMKSAPIRTQNVIAQLLGAVTTLTVIAGEVPTAKANQLNTRRDLEAHQETLKEQHKLEKQVLLLELQQK